MYYWTATSSSRPWIATHWPLRQLARSKVNTNPVVVVLGTCSLLAQSTCASLKLVAVGTWPGLCVTLIEYAANEVTTSVGKKKGPDAAIPKALRRFVQLADDERRTGDNMHEKLQSVRLTILSTCHPQMLHVCLMVSSAANRLRL